MAAPYDGPDTSLDVKDDETVIRFPEVPTYDEFYRRCLVPNRPCVLPAGLVAHWPVVQSKVWEMEPPSSATEAGVDWHALKQHYGTHVSPVVITRMNAVGSLDDNRCDMTIAQAVDLILFPEKDDAVRSIYIKDWHLIKQLRGEEEPYTVPDIFADDWMNNVHGEKDDFRFVYAGTRGSSTLLHRDVYTSYSWSTNVVGRKTWYLFPPRAIPSLRRFPRVETSELVPSLEALRSIIRDKERREYPQLSLALASMQTIPQSPGETIFVPSNWYHQVHNDTDCASINRNWCNSVNLPSMYTAIVEELDHAEEALCDVRDMLSQQKGEEWKREFYGLVQDVAVQDAGWAWKGFWEMILHNLTHPATAEAARPNDAWVKQRLLPLVNDFVQRDDANWLDTAILDTAHRCKRSLEAMAQ